MQPTARQHDADLREQMREQNMQKHDFGTVAEISSQKNDQQSPERLFAANFYEHPRTLRTVLEAKTSDPSLMVEQPGSA
tara:strand:+ start:1177 stop:1413 length:237 start_codon:yes stop_codon:yes gene_type:complete